MMARRRAAALAVLANHLGEPVRLIDVGARGGLDERWEPFHPLLEVLGFEPDGHECERLNQAASSLPYRSRFLPHALGRAGGEVTFNVCRWPVASSIYEPNPELLEDFPAAAALMTVVERRPMTTVSLDEVCAQEGLRPDYLKVDVEGAELDVLQGADRVMDGSLVLDVEVEFAELFRGQPLFADVDEHLRARGWRVLGLRRISWRRPAGIAAGASGYGGQLISADALYFNARALSQGLALGRMLKLALLLSAYRQHDFAAQLLRRAPVSELPSGERESLEAWLARPPAWPRRALSRLLSRREGGRGRALGDALQPGAATVWRDAHHF
jgi:FkbM family methyltransferase